MGRRVGHEGRTVRLCYKVMWKTLAWHKQEKCFNRTSNSNHVFYFQIQVLFSNSICFISGSPGNQILKFLNFLK